MTDNKYEQLVRDYPDIFQKSNDIELSIGDGWYNIISVLFGLISYRLNRARDRLTYSINNPTARMGESLESLEQSVKDELEALPTIDQIKEKFGRLRIYANGGSAEVESYIDFAEAISAKTCDKCGAPGPQRCWPRSLCRNCYFMTSESAE